MLKTLLQIHEDVPANHYDEGIRKNLLQRYWHNRRFSEVLKFVKPVRGAFLDVGCHSGTFTKKILNKIGSKKIYGVDISPSAIKLIKKRISYGYFQVADGVNLPFKNSFFDVTFCLEALEHVDDALAVLKELKRVTKKRGYGIILVPTDNKIFKLVWFLWTMYYPVWRHAHIQSFQGKSLEKTLRGLNLKILNVKTFNLNMLKIVVWQKI